MEIEPNSPGADFDNWSFAAPPPVIIGFMIFSYCLVYKVIISKHYPFQKVSDQWFFWNWNSWYAEIHAENMVCGNKSIARQIFIRMGSQCLEYNEMNKAKVKQIQFVETDSDKTHNFTKNVENQD